ncbi:MAG: hypothetical protein CUN48_03300 [Candidatus Thermofonsia Clade 3 bacterium]|uniref:NnrS family protein n=1 Tax=Candidatus Thermofonsia Clade 3 bacterium TaxID=2364212 RepID=A0A2M8QFB3_9CHLR|nr:hypothetical protein [Candidatus Roseilinea sp. NK_OTU-006]PJF48500.1 MAG: hypothetical protein CUN48_03300 [Candidatus Thermofonsia Clade 3 bacterium]
MLRQKLAAVLTSGEAATAPSRLRLARIVIAALAVVAAMVAAWGGLVRIGWPLPVFSISLGAAHGPLMVCGALMTVIGLERAVALQHRCGEWPFIAPLLSAIGVAGVIGGLPDVLGAPVFSVSSGVLLGVHLAMVRLQPATFARVMASGAALLLIGNALWLSGWPLYRIAPWWIGFLVLTIAGERLELGRVQKLSALSQQAFAGSVIGVCVGIACTIVSPDIGTRILGLGLLALAAWLLRYDVARRTVRMSGLPRFIGACLLSGYLWLGVGGGLALMFGAVLGGPRYDAVLHAIFVGFVFAMILGHAPIILPALLGVSVASPAWFYAPLVLLHASLAVRVLGDLSGEFELRRQGGLLNAAALLLYAALMIYAVRRAQADMPRQHAGNGGNR